MTGNLGYTEIASGQNQKEVTANADFAIFDKAITEQLAVDLTSGNVTVTTTQMQQNIYFIAQNNSVSRTITLPAVKRSLFAVENQGTAILSIKIGSTTLTLGPGLFGLFSADGTTNGLKFFAVAGTTTNLACNVSGLAQNAQRITVIFNDSFQFPASLTGSNFVIGTAPTSTMTWTLNKNGSSIGTVAFSTGGSPTVTFASAVTFSAGDILTVIGPNPADATGADIAFNFKITKL